MVRLTPSEDRLLVAFARAAGLPPAVYARRRLLSEPIATRPLIAATDALLHANRAALACGGLATDLATRGDLISSRKLEAAAREIEQFVHDLTQAMPPHRRDRQG